MIDLELEGLIHPPPSRPLHTHEWYVLAAEICSLDCQRNRVDHELLRLARCGQPVGELRAYAGRLQDERDRVDAQRDQTP